MSRSRSGSCQWERKYSPLREFKIWVRRHHSLFCKRTERIGTLPHSKLPYKFTYRKPARSSPYHHIPHTEDPSYYYPPIYDYVSTVESLHQVFLTKTQYTTFHSTIRPTRPKYFILLDFINSKFSVNKVDRQAPNYVVSSIPFYLSPLSPKYSPQRPTLKHHLSRYLPQSLRPNFTPI